jgi:cyclic pyranopterin phosphate synthase
VGFIGAQSEHFCATCNRLRLTADGRLRPCLMSAHEIDLSLALRAGANLETVRALLAQAIRHKPEGHRLAEQSSPQDRTMAEIGG